MLRVDGWIGPTIIDRGSIMALHHSTFDYLNPTDRQKDDMQHVRDAAKEYAQALDAILPEGPDKTYVMRKLREVNTWAMIAITRHPDGAPRLDRGGPPSEE